MEKRVMLVQVPPPTGKGWVPDTSAASSFGRIMVLLQSGDRPSFRPQACIRVLKNKLKDFNAEHDHILWAGGDPVGLFLVGLVISDLGHKDVSWLRYERDPIRRDDRSSHKYELVRIKLSDAILST